MAGLLECGAALGATRHDSSGCCPCNVVELPLGEEEGAGVAGGVHVYKVVDDTGQQRITCRLVLVDKVLDDGMLKAQARLVVHGFQERGVQDMETFSPTCSKFSWRVLLALAASKGWCPVALDISTAFLQRVELDRDVFVRPPAETNLSVKLLRLRKAVYGVSDAPLQWYWALHEAVLVMGARVVPFDPAIYLFGGPGAVHGGAATQRYLCGLSGRVSARHA